MRGVTVWNRAIIPLCCPWLIDWFGSYVLYSHAVVSPRNYTYNSFCMLELIFPCLLGDVSSPHPLLSWWTSWQNEECTNSSTYMCRIETAQILDLTGSYLSTSVGQQLWYRAKLLSIFSLWHTLLVILWFNITLSCKQARTMHIIYEDHAILWPLKCKTVQLPCIVEAVHNTAQTFTRQGQKYISSNGSMVWCVLKLPQCQEQWLMLKGDPRWFWAWDCTCMWSLLSWLV